MLTTTFQCKYCENVFAKDRHLQKHLRKSHFRVFYNLDKPAGKEKTLQCSHCDEKFRKKRHLEAHVNDVHGWLDQKIDGDTKVPENNDLPSTAIVEGAGAPEKTEFENDAIVAKDTPKEISHVSEATDWEAQDSPMLKSEETQNVDDEEDMDYTEETPR